MNLVLIVSDTFRWDYLGCYGNDCIQTPNLDQLAADSALFVDGYAEGLPTLPARRVILTGRPVTPPVYIPQKDDGVKSFGWHPLFYEDVTLAEWLGQHGYVSAFVTDVYHMMKPGKNFHRGFDCWYWIRGQEGDAYALPDIRQVRDLLTQTTLDPDETSVPHWVIQHLMNRKDWASDEDTSVARVMIKAAKWLNEYTLDSPFFLYVDCFDPHEPWDPPADYAHHYYADYQGLVGVYPPAHEAEMTPEQVRCVKAAYAGEVTLVDRWVGYLLNTLRQRDLMDDTLIIFTSDHGTMMGEQGEIHKGETRLRNQCTRVPLLIRHPESQAAGQRVAGFVQHHDIMPTALSIMGLSAPERALGTDIWPLAIGDTSPLRDTIVIGWSRYASVRTPRWNLITPWTQLPAGQQPVRQLYDLQTDPEELDDVIENHPQVVRELSEFLAEYLRRQASLTKGTVQQVDSSAADQVMTTFDALPGDA